MMKGTLIEQEIKKSDQSIIGVIPSALMIWSINWNWTKIKRKQQGCENKTK